MALCLGRGLGWKECVFEISGLLRPPDSFSCSSTELQPLVPDPWKPMPGRMVGCGLLEAHRAFFGYAVLLPSAQEPC